jgi:SAM-dependent methyltransferase
MIVCTTAVKGEKNRNFGISILVPRLQYRHKPNVQKSTPPAAIMQPAPSLAINDIFNRKRISTRRGRIWVEGYSNTRGSRFLADQMAQQLVERINDIRRTFSNILLVGYNDILADHLIATGVRFSVADPAPELADPRIDTHFVSDMDVLAHCGGPYDAIVWAGGLDICNDVPGALIQARRLLRPDGVVLGCFLGAGSFQTLRNAVQALSDNVARFHPQIDVRATGDLLMRTGFALPTVDIEMLHLRYRSVIDAVRDLRQSACNNMLEGPVHPMTKAAYMQLAAHYLAQASTDGRIDEGVSIIHFIGWAPHESQPQPAKRGSGNASLASALVQKPKE